MLTIEKDLCPECDGLGIVEADCFEDTCCCADTSEHGTMACSFCGGDGWVPAEELDAS